MKKSRPNFKDIKSFEEFDRYYWYREELSLICKSLKLEHRCSKQELNHIIQEYFKGNRIEKFLKKRNKNKIEDIDLNTSLIKCNFSFNKKFRDYFSIMTGISPFKFNADMAATWKKVKAENDLKFTIKDMLKVYCGELNYAKYDNSVCQWNKFIKDFCLDEFSEYYSNKLKVASILWKEVRDSKNEKIYSRKLLDKYRFKIKEYRK